MLSRTCVLAEIHRLSKLLHSLHIIIPSSPLFRQPRVDQERIICISITIDRNIMPLPASLGAAADRMKLINTLPDLNNPSISFSGVPRSSIMSASFNVDALFGWCGFVFFQYHKGFPGFGSQQGQWVWISNGRLEDR